MKKKYFTLLLATVFSFTVISQTKTATFEDLSLAVDTFWNGSDTLGKFTTKNITLNNNYDTAWHSWDGFAYSTKTDTTTAGYGNQYSCIAGKGANNSATYGVSFEGYSIKPTMVGSATNGFKNFKGIYINNSTYAYLSMKNGDAIAKKFGDTTGGADGKDWFKLTIKSYDFFGNYVTSIDFYLADYRFLNNSNDYIIKDWTYLDLTPLGYGATLKFELSSSDNGTWGMNTPAYFCVDNISYYTNPVTSLSENELENITIYPNPTSNFVNVKLPSKMNTEGLHITLTDVNGRIIKRQNNINSLNIVFNIQDIENGVYFLNFVTSNSKATKKIVKK